MFDEMSYREHENGDYTLYLFEGGVQIATIPLQNKDKYSEMKSKIKHLNRELDNVNKEFSYEMHKIKGGP